ncbi:MAG: AMP-binding protein, partial [Pseudomonadota bacterium]|nr:AMP-binding protein [Pseudomonadota bacterium]
PKLPAAPTPSRTEAASNTTEAALLYTSGTTGQPKGCVISNEYFIGLGQWYQDEGGYCALEPGQERLITPLPVNHMNSLACSTMAMIMTGGCIVQLDRFHPSTWWQSVRDSRSTIVHYLGVMPAMLLNLPASLNENFAEQIKFGFGAGVDVRHHLAFEQRFGFPLIEAWAMTETGAGACIAASHEPRQVGTRCFGKAPSTLEYRLVDENGNETPTDQPGELLVRATGERPERNFFSGYHKDKTATAYAWSGGWFHTGDVVRTDAEGSFYFVDRRKNVIRRSGENIAALEVEAALLQQAAVHNCAVAPVADAIRGEEVMACIMLAPETDATRATAEAIVGFTLGALAYFKAPGYVAFVEQLPMTTSQKIQRGEVKRLCAELLENGECFDLRSQKRRRKPETPSA